MASRPVALGGKDYMLVTRNASRVALNLALNDVEHDAVWILDVKLARGVRADRDEDTPCGFKARERSGAVRHVERRNHQIMRRRRIPKQIQLEWPIAQGYAVRRAVEHGAAEHVGVKPFCGVGICDVERELIVGHEVYWSWLPTGPQRSHVAFASGAVRNGLE